MYVFNPEHDLCLANGDANYVPPLSSLKFGLDCSGILPLLFPDEGMVVWGWNAELKQRLVRQGVAPELLPDDSQLQSIRLLSHRRYAVAASRFVYSQSKWSGYLAEPFAEEISDDVGVDEFIVSRREVVLKAPWSGSGKGLRWISCGSFSSSDKGWWHNVISRQGSVIAEKREIVAVDFAALFRVSSSSVSFEGYSLFNTSNGVYKSNVLASDEYILEYISEYLPLSVILDSVDLIKSYISEHFLGNYQGYLGVDMFVCRDGDRFLLAPCVEINVRMTMGLVARRCFDKFISGYGKDADGRYTMNVVHSADSQEFHNELSEAEILLTEVGPQTSYAIAVFVGEP